MRRWGWSSRWVGSALDNAAAESFNSTLEWELLSRRRFATKARARSEVAKFIDAYNHQRRHSSCEMKPPAVYYEQILAERARNKRHENRRFTATPRPSKPTRKRPKRETMRNYNHQPETLHDFKGSPHRLGMST